MGVYRGLGGGDVFMGPCYFILASLCPGVAKARDVIAGTLNLAVAKHLLLCFRL